MPIAANKVDNGKTYTGCMPLQDSCMRGSDSTIALGYFMGGFLLLLPCLFVSSVLSGFDCSVTSMIAVPVVFS